MPPSPPATFPSGPGKPRRRYAPRMPPERRREQLVDAALAAILERGYAGVSVEAVAHAAGVTRPVVYDHFTNLGELVQALVEREERYSLAELDALVPSDPGDRDPGELLATSVRRFLTAVAGRPATWRLILLPLEGTPSMVREHVEHNRANVLKRIEHLVRWSMGRSELPRELDVELVARAIRDLGEEAGRMVLTDPEAYTPQRYEDFVRNLLTLLGKG